MSSIVVDQDQSAVLTEQHVLPLAVVDGEVLTKLPIDLYIPPGALEVFLETFEGPLDLLLYLIRKQNIDLLNIPVAEITRQYMSYIELMQSMQLELAAEYLLMSAMLIEIKSQLLLPRIVTDDEEEDPRAQLIKQLQEYERYKTAADNLDQLKRDGRNFQIPALDYIKPESAEQKLPEVGINELINSMTTLLQKAEHFAIHHVQKEILSTRQKMSDILGLLNDEKFVAFTQLCLRAEGRMGVVVTFMAILELIKESFIDLVQNEGSNILYVRKIC